jgi:hypothetical protein
MGKVSPGTIIAAIALFIVIGGTATAASGLINGKKIKPGTVTAKQIKNKTITTAKLAPSTVKSLEGAPGETGPAGPKGAPGETGPAGTAGATGATGPAGAKGATGPAGTPGATGADGIVAPEYAETTEFDLPYGDYPTVLSLNVDPGAYMINAKTNVISQQAGSNPNRIACSIWTDETSAVDQAFADRLYSNQEANLSMMALADVEGLITLECTSDDANAELRDVKLIAVPVQPQS